ncbi:sensor histidine kinase [Flagellimonas nanhaiensis]|nr:histidine kinase [Allomuricauda nanhaiensis]
MLNTKSEGFIERKLVVLLALFYTGLTIISMIKTIYLKVFVGLLGFVTWTDIIISMILEWMGVMGFAILISYLIKSLIERKTSWRYIIPIHLFCALIFGALMTFLHQLATIIDNLPHRRGFNLERLRFNFIQYFEYNLLVYFTITFIIYTYFYIKSSLAESEKKNIIQQKFHEAKTLALQNQLHPHFLFNSLNSVSALIDIDKEKSKDMIADISEYLYNTVNLHEHKLISLEHELELLDKYLNIIETRFQAQLSIKKEIHLEPKSIQVPPLIIQPLVENAVKHGYSATHQSLIVEIEISIDENKLLVIEVRNNGTPLDKNLTEMKKKGTGIKNIDERLRAIYGQDYQLNCYNDMVSSKVVYQIILIPNIDDLNEK